MSMSADYSTAHAAHIVRISQSASALITLYDHLLTLDREVALIWKREYDPRSALFIVMRYFGEAILIANATIYLNWTGTNQEICNRYLSFQAWGTSITIWAVQGLILYRVNATYKNNMRIIVISSVLFAMVVLTMSVILGLMFNPVHENPIPETSICSSTNNRKYFYTFSLPVIYFASAFTALHMWSYIRHVMNMRKILDTWRVNPALEISSRDISLYFVFTAIVFGVGGTIWFTWEPIWTQVPQGITLAVTVITGSRLVLNLRQVFQRRDSFTYIPYVKPPMHFALPFPDEDANDSL